jgi:chitin synthase
LTFAVVALIFCIPLICFCSGESGSGKSELSSLIIQHLARLSANKKRSKIQDLIINGQKVLQAFGSAQTTLNKHASRVGIYIETHYNERGKMVGAKFLHYFLEKSRVSGGKSSEGNFNVFYWLLAGTSPDEKQVLQLKDEPKDYEFLAKCSRPLLHPTDDEKYKELKKIIRAAGFRREHFSRIIQLLAAILHLGNIQFVDSTGIGAEEVVTIRNQEALETVADFLGVSLVALESILKFKTTVIGRDVTTLILNAEQAATQRDELAQTLYSLLFSWLVERINQKIYTESFNSFTGVLDFPGTQPFGFASVGFQQFCVDYANERIYNFMLNRLFEADKEEFDSEMIQVPQVSYSANTACVELLERPSRGICAILNKMSEKAASGKRNFSDNNIIEAIKKYNTESSALSITTSNTGAYQFTIQHFVGEVTYDPNGFLSKNSNQPLVDFINLFRGSDGEDASSNAFALELFSDQNLSLDSPHIGGTSVEAQQSSKPTRLPSMRKSKRKTSELNEVKRIAESTVSSGKRTVLAQIQTALDDLISSFQETTTWSVFCVRPNTTGSTTEFDSILVQSQIKAFNVDCLATKMKHFYMVSMPHEDFLSRYAIPLNRIGLIHDGTYKEQCERIKESNNWSDQDIDIGTNKVNSKIRQNEICIFTSYKVFLSYQSWYMFEEELRALEKQEQKNLAICDSNDILPNGENDLNGQPGKVTESRPLSSMLGFSDEQRSYYTDDEYNRQRQFIYNKNGSHYGNDSLYGESRFHEGSYYTHVRHKSDGLYTPPQQDPPEEDLDATEEKESSMTPGRKRWLWFVWLMTFWIPNLLLIKCGRMKRKDIRIAWREKVALCVIITCMCGFVIWFLVFFGELICPYQDVFSVSELNSHNQPDDGYVAIRGEVFNLGDYASHHYPPVVPTSAVLEYAGKDATDLFPIQVSDLCENVSPYVSLDYHQNHTDENAQYHDFTFSSDNYKKDWYYDQLTFLRRNYKVGDMGIEPKAISDQAKGAYTLNGTKMNRVWAVINDCVYDLTTYILGGRYLAAPPGEVAPEGIDTNFLNAEVVDLFWQNSGTDISEKFQALSLTAQQRNRELVCIRNLYFVGMVDKRNSTKCQFSTYFLLAVTICLCLVIFFKFVAAVRFGSVRMPEQSEKFVICQVTCYTEDEESLRKTIDSLAKLRYDDKRKLIVVICDGMIIGSGNDRPTPRIVLDIFGVDPQIDPEALSFISVGEGIKQHNRAKVYSGLYEIAGHVVPYLVIAKVGAPNEGQKPGNRGKRDSQLVLMQFLNRVQYNAPMNPMQLEMYHQMRNIIGISPELYDYVLMVDADTEVMPDGLNYLVSSMSHDAKIIGVCGETTLANEKDTWVTMIQVYEYFISHHMIKSFESLFATVSCLPGCFTMYRIRTVDGKRPLFVSNEIVDDYTINVVDTLHKKNLLYLGEDRYLTTLLLKHFPNYKTKFNPDAQCKTNAPDTWAVLISQRRRWINSTVHNLGELAFLPHLCGFCCFSMRFVVMLDLISTLVQPALLGYLGFLIYKLATATNQIPYITIITLCCTYGLQIILFIFYKRWEYIVWFLLSILALPVFSFYIPVYSYWHFDDFSWGNTRVVVGEKGKKVTVGDEGEFDPKSIPLMTWSQYEKALFSESYSDGMSHYSSNYYRLSPMSVHSGQTYCAAGVSGDLPIYPSYGRYSPSVGQHGSSYSVHNNSEIFPAGGGYYAADSTARNQSVSELSITDGPTRVRVQSGAPGGHGSRLRCSPTTFNDGMSDIMGASMVHSYYAQNMQHK